MRVVLVGSAAERERLRSAVNGGAIEVAGEYETVGAARGAPMEYDAVLLARRPRDGAALEPLTPREREVIALVVDGLSNKSIAARLGISDQTVKAHVASICGKLGAANRTDAVRRAIRNGLVAV